MEILQSLSKQTSMSMIQYLPYYLQRVLEDFGLEEEVSQRQSNLYVEFPDFDMAYSFRERLQKFDVEFKMISHPSSGNPVVEIFNVIPFSRD
jgi:hypothetical protein